MDTDRSTRGIHVNICIGCSGTCVGGESLAVDPCIGHGLVQTILGSCSPLELPIVSHSAFNILGGSNNRGLVCHVMTSAIHPHEPFHQRVWLSVIGALRMAQHDAC